MTSIASMDSANKTAVRWAAVRHELLNLSWMLMELALIVPIALGLLPWGRLWSPQAAFLLLFSIMTLSFLLIRLMNQLELSKYAQQNVMVGTLLLVELLVVRLLVYSPAPLFDLSWIGTFFNSIAELGNQQWFFDVSLFLIVALVWWRGMRLVGRDPSIDKAGLYLRSGGLIAAPFAIWLGRSLLWNITPFLLLFFTAGLTTIALIRAEQLEISNSGQAATVTPRWLGTIVAVTVLVATTAVSLAAILSNEITLSIVRFFAPVWLAVTFLFRVLSSTLLYVGRPLFFLFELLFMGLTAVLAWLLARLVPLLNNGLAQAGLGTAEEPFALPEDEAVIQQALNDQIIVILLLLAVVLVVALAVRRAVQQRTAASTAVSRTLAPPKIEQQGSLLERLRDRLRDLANWGTAVSIRRTYRRMCQTAASLGFPRGQAQTPTEYLQTLHEAWPDHQPETAIVTNAYIKVRYGEYPETDEELMQIREAWHKLEHAARQKSGRQATSIDLQNNSQ